MILDKMVNINTGLWDLLCSNSFTSKVAERVMSQEADGCLILGFTTFLIITALKTRRSI